jgi:hypothetical protein
MYENCVKKLWKGVERSRRRLLKCNSRALHGGKKEISYEI